MGDGRVLADAAPRNLDVFISYRRHETSYLAAWLFDALSERLGDDRVFLDADSIRPGLDFDEVIRTALERCRVLLVLIGPEWLAGDEQGRRRIDDPEDWVRIEVAAALAAGVDVLPVLLDDVSMPSVGILPIELAGLPRKNAFSVRRATARADIARLVGAIDQLLGSTSAAASRRVSASSSPMPSTVTSDRLSAWRADGLRESNQYERFRLQLNRTYAGYVRQSLHYQGSIHIPLQFDIVTEETSRPTDWLFRPRRLADDQSSTNDLLGLFEEHVSNTDGMLILGGPGSGKTTILFEMAAQLARQSLQHPDAPLPVYVSLAAWRGRRHLMAEWLVLQLRALYQVPTELARHWIQCGRILFLLDGLDEIEDHATRAACVEEINRFTRFGRKVLVPTVVTSRKAEYRSLRTKLQLEVAAEVRPLDPGDVLQYLEDVGPVARPVMDTVKSNPELRDLLRSPLLLSIFVSTGDLASLKSQDGGQGSMSPQLLISRYVEHRLAHEGDNGAERTQYDAVLTRRWLTALSRKLDRSGKGIFLLEELDTEWLLRPSFRRIVLVAPALVWGLGVGTLLALVVYIARRLRLETTTGPLAMLIVFCSLGLAAGLVAEMKFSRRALVWVTFGLSSALLSADLNDLTNSIAIDALIYSAVFCLLGEIVVRLIGGELQRVEQITWSWAAVRAGIVPRLAIGVVIASVYSVPNWLTFGFPLGRAVLLGVVFGVITGLLLGATLGLQLGLGSTLVPVRRRPNEGIRRSARFGAIISLAGTVLVSALFFASGVIIDTTHGLIRALAWGPTTGILWGLAAGGGAAIQHWTLRLLLWQEGIAPLRYNRWLAYVVRLRILYWGVGGGYLFVHRMIQEHFLRCDSNR